MILNRSNPETLDLLLSRRSVAARTMVDPAPTQPEMEKIMSAALRVPDHGKLSPWRYIVLTGDDRQKLGAAIATALEAEQETSDRILEKMKDYGNQAPMVVIAIFSENNSRPIPLWEQQLSMGASIQNMIIATHALGYVANWLTGWGAFSPTVASELGLLPSEKIAGFIFMGSAGDRPSERERPSLDDKVQWTI